MYMVVNLSVPLNLRMYEAGTARARAPRLPPIGSLRRPKPLQYGSISTPNGPPKSSPMSVPFGKLFSVDFRYIFSYHKYAYKKALCPNK